MMKASDGRWFQIGATIFGMPNDFLDTDVIPGAYVDVRKHCEWIRKSTKGEARSQFRKVTLKDIETRT
ncbi:hypothetical protein PMAYCL1PPCAC_08107 [Pristionchus mayeri]|uniref:Peptidase n=1 Tax=Pristionchus mayeri TaxID=1317129 RepID=A0AAN4ZB22_9BILA|nr:hypothetical protein PMAYCL1PPCAC_08107 [Pristionchus mayeri]